MVGGDANHVASLNLQEVQELKSEKMTVEKKARQSQQLLQRKAAKSSLCIHMYTCICCYESRCPYDREEIRYIVQLTFSCHTNATVYTEAREVRS